ncbi:radical SAM protein [Streptomyces sp. NPDC001205]
MTPPLDERERAFSLRNDVYHLILLPTEQCNFRCTYCYEDFSIGRMKPEIVQGVKRLIDRRLSDLRLLQISWFGGEPLLAADIIEDISGHIMATMGPQLRYLGDMTTNGYLLNGAMLRRMTAVGINDFQISLDGPEKVHDRTRVRADGRGSFRRLWQNLLAIRHGEASVTVVLRVHLTPDNLPAMPEFLARIRETFLADARFSVHLKPVERLGGQNDAEMQVLDKRTRPSTLDRLQAIVNRPGQPDASPNAPVCYAARPNSLMIRANGRLGKCTVSLNDPGNDLGRLRPDGTLEFRNDRLGPWLRGWDSGDQNALHCPADGFTLRDPEPGTAGKSERATVRQPVLLQIGPPPHRRNP